MQRYSKFHLKYVLCSQYLKLMSILKEIQQNHNHLGSNLYKDQRSS